MEREYDRLLLLSTLIFGDEQTCLESCMALQLRLSI
jgi:hypothetical protein